MAHIPSGTVSQSPWGPSSLPFAMPDAGFDYFATDAHYRSLASRIITALGGFNVVVVTGDRRLSTPTLSTALGDAIAGRYTVIGFPCEPEPSRHDVLRFRRAVSTSSANNGAAGGVSGLPALIVFDGADRCSDKEIEKIFEHAHQRSRIGDHRIAAVVFLASTEFLTRLERPVLSFWLAKRLFVARLRFHELGADEISAFIHHQLPAGEAESIFNDAAIAAIANVSGGDPAVVNQFARRMLNSLAADTGDTSVKANVGLATMVPPDMLPEERGVTTFREQPRQNRMAPELGMSRDRRVTLKLCAGIVVCFACVGVVAAVIHINPEEDISASGSTRAKRTSAKVPERGSLISWPPPEASMPPAAVSPSEEPTAVPGKAAVTATTTPAAPTPEDALPVKMPAQSPSLAALHPTAEVAGPTEAPEKIVSATISPTATATGASPIATTVSPTGKQAPKSTPSAPGSPLAQLRLPTAEIAALLARGDTLFAQRDISSARLFYERAADAGEGRAALRLGKTFDPVFLEFTHPGVRADSAMAVSWYGRARELGEAEAEILLKRLEPASSK